MSPSFGGFHDLKSPGMADFKISSLVKNKTDVAQILLGLGYNVSFIILQNFAPVGLSFAVLGIRPLHTRHLVAMLRGHMPLVHSSFSGPGYN